MQRHNNKCLVFILLFSLTTNGFASVIDFDLRQDSLLLNRFILPGIKKSDSLLNTGENLLAIQTARLVIDSIGNNANYIQTTAQAYYVIAKAHKNLGQNSIALKNFLQTVQILKLLNESEFLGIVYRDLGEIYEDWGLVVKATEYYRLFLEHTPSKDQQIDVFVKIAALFEDIESYENANLYLSRLLKLYSMPGYESEKLRTLQSMTENHLKSSSFDKAIFLQNQVLQIQESLDDQEGVLFTINNLAHIYLQMANYEAAMKYFRAYFERVGEKKPVNMDKEEKLLFAKTQVTFGKYLEDFGDLGEPDNYKSSLEYYQKGLELYLSLNNKSESACTFYYLARIYFKISDFKNSIVQCENSIFLAESPPDYNTLMMSYDLLSRSYESLEKYKQAHQASKQYIIYRDSVVSAKMARQISLVKKHSESSSNESYIHKIEQMIAEEEMNNLAITRLELQADKNRQEIELLAKEKSLQDYSLKNEQLEKEKALQALELINRKYEAEIKDREIDNLQKNREIQALALRQQILEQKEKEREISMLEKEKQLGILELQKADAQRYILIITVLLSTIVLGLVIRSYVQAKRSREKIAMKNAEIEENNQKLTQLNQEKNRLIRIVAHDLRNPLTAALSMTGILKTLEKDLPGNYTHSLSLVRKSLLRMQEMIIKILDIKAIDQERINLEFEAVNLGKIADHVAELFSEKARQKNISLWVESLDVYALADRNFLIQVLENLVSNAIKFSKHGSMVALTIQDNFEKCRIIVKDNGPGFSEHDQALMFTEYQRLSSNPVDGEKSNGMGLSIAKKYIDAMNGRIWCESAKGKGAVFTIEFFKALQEA
jgi:signal transduction histidine kinase